MDYLQVARQVILGEASALSTLCHHLDESFVQAVDAVYTSTGRLVLVGTGKCHDIAQKLAGTFNSTGTKAHLLDVTKAAHGDLGMLDKQDIVLAFSFSGETSELVQLLPAFAQLAGALIGVTGRRESTLADKADLVLWLGPIKEVCPLGLAPSASTTAMLALGDAMAFTLATLRGFTKDQFARIHPSGRLGRLLMPVDNVMRCGRQLRVASRTSTVRQAFSAAFSSKRRSGAVLLVDNDGRLAGIFTDSDLARLIEQDGMLNCPIAEVMTVSPIVLSSGARVEEAVQIMRENRISELPIVDAGNRPIGLVDITDLVGLISEAELHEKD